MTDGALIALAFLASAPDRETAQQQLLVAWSRGADTEACQQAWADYLANSASTVHRIGAAS